MCYVLRSVSGTVLLPLSHSITYPFVLGEVMEGGELWSLDMGFFSPSNDPYVR